MGKEENLEETNPSRFYLFLYSAVTSLHQWAGNAYLFAIAACAAVRAFALGSEVRELLADPDNPALLSRGQQYTEDFAAIKGIFEGLYISTPSTYVLTHTSEEAIGITTRSGESLEQFQDTILAKPELTNLGIMKSPGSGSMIISMYYPIFDGQDCIGYVGAGVYASRLMDVLRTLLYTLPLMPRSHL